MARRRGTIVGPLLMLLGVWGAIIPFVGHYFGYGYSPDNTWGWTDARGWLEVLPGCLTLLCGMVITASANRVVTHLAGWLAAASGAWFILGTVVTPWWSGGFIGVPSGDASQAAWEQIGMFDGLGILILLLAAWALGRSSVVGLRDVDGHDRIGAYRRIEDAPAYPNEPSATTTTPTTTDARTTEAERSLR